jgi:tetraacyldisaccharide 4'-kinase
MSRLFGAFVGIRSALYDRGYLRPRRLRHPVISVGNLTVGGTGKTPLVIALAEALAASGRRPVVLSRGYRRQSRGVVVVSRGHGPEVGWEEAGDEPFLIARRVPGAAVVVGADRFGAGRRAEEHDLGDVFLLDDGFQHRQLARDLDLVAVDPADWAGPDRLLPGGRWREPKEALGRADAALVSEGSSARAPQLDVPAFSFTTHAEGIVRNGVLEPLSGFAGQRVVAFAGIAKPERFFDALEGAGLELAARVRFRDHHRYRERRHPCRLGPLVDTAAP